MGKFLKSVLTIIFAVILVIAILVVYAHLYEESPQGKLATRYETLARDALDEYEGEKKQTEELEEWRRLSNAAEYRELTAEETQREETLYKKYIEPQVPILRDKNEPAEWSEAAATAGAIRTAVRAYYAENPTAAGLLAGTALTDATAAQLGFKSGDLTGQHFTVGNFTIAASPAMSTTGGRAATMVSSTGTGLTGTGRLDDAAGWVYTP